MRIRAIRRWLADNIAKYQREVAILEKLVELPINAVGVKSSAVLSRLFLSDCIERSFLQELYFKRETLDLLQKILNKLEKTQ